MPFAAQRNPPAAKTLPSMKHCTDLPRGAVDRSSCEQGFLTGTNPNQHCNRTSRSALGTLQSGALWDLTDKPWTAFVLFACAPLR